MAAGSRGPVSENWQKRRGRRQLPERAGLEPARREALGRSAPASGKCEANTQWSAESSQDVVHSGGPWSDTDTHSAIHREQCVRVRR